MKEIGTLETAILNIIHAHFSDEDVALVIQELESITLDHVMARSETNLYNTRLAVLTLAQNDLIKVRSYVESAKIDFRDVIYWASDSY